MRDRRLEPFGQGVTLSGERLSDLSAEEVRGRVAKDRLVVFRGAAAPSDEEMLSFCGELGELLEWEFGAINELEQRADANNYLYTEREVPFHWDGAFVERPPSYIFFHCDSAGSEGGETTFCDTIRLLAGRPDLHAKWARIRITYRTEKIVHYGGQFSSPMLLPHPASGEQVIRFAEPVDDLNPVTLSIEGLTPEERQPFLSEMHELLNDPRFCHAHRWETGDIVLADNHALLHGRRAMQKGNARRLRRINVL